MPKAILTQDKLKEVLKYDPMSGNFTWLIHKQGIRTNKKAGRFTGVNGRYIDITINQTPYLSHRLAWLYIYGKFPDNDIDHINGDGRDNRISNLRDVTRSENGRNQRIGGRNKSGVIGVHFDLSRNKWLVTINKGKNSYLGRFIEKWDAICARKSAEYKRGFHKNHGDRLVLISTKRI